MKNTSLTEVHENDNFIFSIFSRWKMDTEFIELLIFFFERLYNQEEEEKEGSSSFRVCRQSRGLCSLHCFAPSHLAYYLSAVCKHKEKSKQKSNLNEISFFKFSRLQTCIQNLNGNSIDFLKETPTRSCGQNFS